MTAEKRAHRTVRWQNVSFRASRLRRACNRPATGGASCRKSVAPFPNSPPISRCPTCNQARRRNMRIDHGRSRSPVTIDPRSQLAHGREHGQSCPGSSGRTSPSIRFWNATGWILNRIGSRQRQSRKLIPRRRCPYSRCAGRWRPRYRQNRSVGRSQARRPPGNIRATGTASG